jgi:hypothetical protein
MAKLDLSTIEPTHHHSFVKSLCKIRLNSFLTCTVVARIKSSKERVILQEVYAVKGTVSRDFRPSVFFHNTIPSGPLIHDIKPF